MVPGLQKSLKGSVQSNPWQAGKKLWNLSASAQERTWTATSLCSGQRVFSETQQVEGRASATSCQTLHSLPTWEVHSGSLSKEAWKNWLFLHHHLTFLLSPSLPQTPTTMILHLSSYITFRYPQAPHPTWQCHENMALFPWKPWDHVRAQEKFSGLQHCNRGKADP